LQEPRGLTGIVKMHVLCSVTCSGNAHATSTPHWSCTHKSLRSSKLPGFASLWSNSGSLSMGPPTRKSVLGCQSSMQLMVLSRYQFMVGYFAVLIKPTMLRGVHKQTNTRRTRHGAGHAASGKERARLRCKARLTGVKAICGH
jgi:hypothetical protein